MLYSTSLLQALQSTLVRYLPCWGMGADCHVSLLSISENATFMVTNANDWHCILRLYRPDYHNDTEILSELEWMLALEKNSIIRIPHIYPTVYGELLTICEIASIRWRIVCFEYLSGSTPSLNAASLEWFEKLGILTAQLHIQSYTWQKPLGFYRKHWTYETMASPQAYFGDWRQVRNLHSTAYRLLERCDYLLKKRLYRLSRQRENYILLHADLRTANLLIDSEYLAVIDFDDCGFSWKALDFANAVSFMEDHPLMPELQQAWLSGYATVTYPSKELISSIELFVMMRRMQLMGWIVTHAETPTAQKLGESHTLGTINLAENFLTKPF